ncbi:MAG: non-heme iron oxygenase ferredoxin subunit [Actinobacteria bacterium]|nr:non-heme iron oxygenase ferredoxin subunit [Actinomycetota bacterium]
MRVAVTALDDLPNERGVRVRVGDLRIAMFRVGDEVFALDDRCSHAEAWLSEGEIFDDAVECPRHGSEFNLRTGRPMSLPATKPVPVYPVDIEDGTVYLTISEETQ